MSYVAVAVTGFNALQQINNGRYQRGLSDIEAGQMEWQAQAVRDEAKRTAEMIRRAGARTVSAADAAYAGAGVKLGAGGTAEEVTRQIRQDVESDAWATWLSGEREASGLTAQAAVTRSQGRQAERAGYWNAATVLASSYVQTQRASGWRANGPGFSGQQAPAPVQTITVK